MSWKESRRLFRAAVLTMHVLLGMLLSLAVLILPLRRRLVHKIGPWWLGRRAPLRRINVIGPNNGLGGSWLLFI